MYTVGIVTQFEAAHRLRGDFGPATRLHGHTYRVEIAVAGPALRDDGTLCDIGFLQGTVDEIVGALHYRELDELEAFSDKNSTAEVVARYLFEGIAAKIEAPALTSLTVTVWESPQAFAAYEGPLPPMPPDGG